MEHAQNRLSLRHWQRVFAVVWCLLGMPMVGYAQQADGEALALALRNNVVGIVATRSDGIHNGFGFIVADRQGQGFIVTANHVVRSGGPDGEATRILVRFFQEQGKSYQATLLETSDQTYDLAVLQVQLPAGLTWQRAVLGPQRAERRTPVWFVGRSGEWYVPTVPGRINTLTLDLKYLLDNLPVRVGTSGAPLIADTGIIGMVTSDASESSEAVSIDIIARAFAQWNLPWQLTPLRSGESHGTRPKPTPPAAPATPPAAPVTVPVAPATPPTAAPVLGRLCPTLSNGETGTLMAVSRQGKELEVYSGSCIDLEPGTYLLTNEDRDIYCLPFHVKVKEGKTNYFRLTCR
jgi:hypothetical protein